MTDPQSEIERLQTAVRNAQNLADHYRTLADRYRQDLEIAQRQLHDLSGTTQAIIDTLRPVLPSGFRGDNPVWACGKLVDYIDDLRSQLESLRAELLAAQDDTTWVRQQRDFWRTTAQEWETRAQECEARALRYWAALGRVVRARWAGRS